jgi:DNA (cytosine-5)-methyltransferase 3A
MRLLNEVKPKYFLLENVMMGEKWEKILSKAIGVNPIMINSSLVSAQNRQRLYWTNIGMKPSGLFGDLESIIEQPKDLGILLKDILDHEVDEKYFLSQKMIDGFLGHNKNHEGKTGFVWQPTEGNKKGACLRANAALAATDNSIIVGGDYRYDEGFRWRENGKSGTLCLGSESGVSGQALAKINSRIRRLTPIECERLQTVKDNYTNHVSDSQRYKMLGNGWTVDVIAHFFKYML